MLVNKINNTSFKGYNYVINSVGDLLYKFSYPHDESTQEAKIEFYKSGASDGDKPIKVINLKETNTVNFDEIPALDKEKTIAYRVIIDGKHVIDSGLCTNPQDSNKSFNIINRNSTAPLNISQAILTMPDIQRPGAYYNDFNSDNTGSINYDINKQKFSENIIRTFSNQGGGSLAGIEYDLDEFKKIGIKRLFMTPVWGGDNISAHHYWNKNDMQIAETLGNSENYETFLRKLYKNGMQYVDDIAITSEGLEGIHVQYALRWANQNPQTYYWFQMNGIKNSPITLGVVPKNKENLRHRIINPSVIYNPKTKKIEKNSDYNSQKETYFQIYDTSQVSEEQLAQKDELITNYKNTQTDNKLLINTYNDTIINYAFEIRPYEYENRLQEFIKMNSESNIHTELNSPKGTLFIGQFTNFKIGENAEGAVFWDANKDIFKRNYYISGYNEKLLNSIPNLTERDDIRKLIIRANYEVRDIAIQAGVYRTQLVKDVQTLYTAQILQNASSKKDIDKFIEVMLPKESQLDSESIDNILGGWYNLSPKKIDTREDVTLKALMKLPLDSLELGENTVGVLATSFFMNRASCEENIGLSRFDFYKKGAGVYSPYHTTYHYMDNLYATKLNDFAYEVINTVNKTSQEKLLDTNGNYTEYGEYVIDLLGKDIAKYAFLKSLAKDKLQSKILSDDVLKGKITYNYPELKKATTLKALGINSSGPEEEAKDLIKLISDGLGKLNRKDIEYVAKSVSQQIEGTTLNGFRLAEAMVNKAGLGLDFRLDAAKDIVDMDAVRNGDMSFDEAWNQVIDFWKKYVSEIKKINPNSYIVAEITDLDQLTKSIYGVNANVLESDLTRAGSKYKNVSDALRVFFEETGISSEASYSYTFTDLLHEFSADGEYGNINKNGIQGLKNRIEDLIKNNNLDYIRNLWTFADNLDKPSVLHVMALDMSLFHANDLNTNFNDLIDEKNRVYELKRRNARISVLQELTNSDNFEDLPLEAMMNIDNNDYFKTVNTRASAMSKLIRSAINESLPNTFNMKNALKEALVDLTNGNYLTNEPNLNIQTIDIPALKTLETALDEILSKTSINLSESDKNKIIQYAKQREHVEKFAIHGDFDWKTAEGNTHWAAKEIQKRATSALGTNENNLMQYSPYTVSIAALLLDSYKDFSNNNNTEEFIKGTREFVHKYNRKIVDEYKKQLPVTQNSLVVQKQKAYAARDIETVIEMVIQQAEFKTGNKFSDTEKNYIKKNVFESATEPAVKKALMYASFLSALPGIPSLFIRDIFGGLGYDEKAKNIFLQNRNTVLYSELEEDGPLKEYRTKIFNDFRNVMQIRNAAGLEVINNGTPYILDTNNNDSMALLYHDDTNNDVITIINTGDINPENRVIYNENASNKYVPIQKPLELDEILLPTSIALTTGMIFINMLDSDKIQYVVNKAENGIYRLIRKDGGKIVLNNETAKNGAMFLKRAGKLAFKGYYQNYQSSLAISLYKESVSNNF